MSKSNASKPQQTPAVDLTGQLKTAIQNSGLKVSQIATKAGIPQPVLQRFISGGRNNIRLDTASKLASFLGMRFTGPCVVAGSARG